MEQPARPSQSALKAVDDPRNENVLVMSAVLRARDQASVSVFDAGFVLGGVSETPPGVASWSPSTSMKRLYGGAGAIQLDIGLSKAGMITMQATLDTTA